MNKVTFILLLTILISSCSKTVEVSIPWFGVLKTILILIFIFIIIVLALVYVFRKYKIF